MERRRRRRLAQKQVAPGERNATALGKGKAGDRASGGNGAATSGQGKTLKKKKAKKEKGREEIPRSRSDVRAVVGIYDDLSGPEWTCKTNWRTKAVPSSWWGLTFENTQLPMPSDLTQGWRLLELRLSNNGLVGCLPSSLARLTAIRHLDLSENSLDGPLIPELSQLTSLQFMDLSMNLLTGPIIPEVFASPELSHLYLQRNRLDGWLRVGGPASAGMEQDSEGSESGLEVLCVEHNRLYGEPSFDLSRFHYPWLSEVRMHGNRWVDAALAKQRLRAALPAACDLAV